MRIKILFPAAVTALLLGLATLVAAAPANIVSLPVAGTPESAAGQAAPEWTFFDLCPSCWAVWANIPGGTPARDQDCVWSAPTQGGSTPEQIAQGWSPLPDSGAGNRFPGISALDWLRQIWAVENPDPLGAQREAMRGALEVALLQLRADGRIPACRALELEPAACYPYKRAVALASGFNLTPDGKYVFLPHGGQWWEPRFAFLLKTSEDPECAPPTGFTPTPTSTPSPTASPTVVTPTTSPTVVTPTATPTATVTPTPVTACWLVPPFAGWNNQPLPHGWNAFAFSQGQYQVTFPYVSIWQGVHKFWAASVPSQSAPFWQDITWEWFNPLSNRWEVMNMIGGVTGTGWASLPTGAVQLRITNLLAHNAGRCGWLWLDPQEPESLRHVYLPLIQR